MLENLVLLRTSFNDDLSPRIFDIIEKFVAFDGERGGHAEHVWQKLLSTSYPALKTWRLAHQLCALVLRVFCNRECGISKLQFIEYFAGTAGLTMAMLRRGLSAAAFDIIFQPVHHDCLTAVGLRCWLDALAATTPQAFTWCGTKCSSFVALSSSQAGRTPENGFRGNDWRPFVSEGNGLAEVTALVWLISYLVGNVCGLEQPLSSCLPETRSMSSVLTFCGARKVVTYSACYGARSLKPLQLWFTTDRFDGLTREKPNWAFDTLATRGENGSFTGKKHEVAESEHYPELFCSEVASVYCEQFLN